MNHLSKVEEALTKTQKNTWIKAIVTMLTLMLEAGLKTYGREPGADAWFMALTARGVRVDELKATTIAYVSGNLGSNFPSAGDFADQVLLARQNLELQEAMVQEIADQDAIIRRQREELNMERYGTPNPTREQIDARLKPLLGTDAITAANNGKLFAPDRTDLRDPDQEAKVQRQIEEAKAARGGNP